MTKSICHFLIPGGCFVRIQIDWDTFDHFVQAREHLAKRLGAEFMFSDDLP